MELVSSAAILEGSGSAKNTVERVSDIPAK